MNKILCGVTAQYIILFSAIFLNSVTIVCENMGASDRVTYIANPFFRSTLNFKYGKSLLVFELRILLYKIYNIAQHGKRTIPFMIVYLFILPLPGFCVGRKIKENNNDYLGLIVCALSVNYTKLYIFTMGKGLCALRTHRPNSHRPTFIVNKIWEE